MTVDRPTRSSSVALLAKYIRLVVEGTADARVPNQLIEPADSGTDEAEAVDEFAAAGGGAGNTLGSGNIAGYTAPLGMDPDKLGRKKNRGQKK